MNERTVNILCLHGKGGNGPNFRTTLGPLWERFRISIRERQESEMNDVTTTHNAVSIHVDYLTAPFPVPNDLGDGTQWWTLPPNTRSFNAPSYDGFDTSADLVQTALRTKKYDLLLGHSQGSILLSALIGTKQPEWWGPVHPSPVGCVLNGCAWPNPFTEEMNSHMVTNVTNDGGCIGNLLFVIGRTDGINPPEEAIRVRDCFEKAGMGVDTCEHAGGHSVPVRDEVAVREVCDWMVKLVDI